MGWGGGNAVLCPPLPTASHLATELRANWWDDGKEWVRCYGRVRKGDPCRRSSLPCPPTQAYLSSCLKRVALFWGSKPWATHTARGEVWHCVGENGVQCFGIFLFCLKKTKIRSIELLQLGQMERTAEGLISIHTHTHTLVHELFWSEII